MAKRLTARQWGRALYEFTKEAREPEARKIIRGFVALLAKKGALKLAPRIIASYRATYLLEANEVEVTVTSARRIPKIEKDIKAAFGDAYTKVSVREEIEPALLGGVVIQYGDIRVDASIRGRLRDLEAQMNSL